jgi:CHASE2 domain-containing sensor protein
MCTLATAALAVLLSIVRPAAMADLELRAYDELLRRTTRPPPTGRVSIVAVDDKSIAEIGQWPWGRDVVARLVERLSDLGARVIALDVILSEPDRLGSSLPTGTTGELIDRTTDPGRKRGELCSASSSHSAGGDARPGFSCTTAVSPERGHLQPVGPESGRGCIRVSQREP